MIRVTCLGSLNTIHYSYGSLAAADLKGRHSAIRCKMATQAEKQACLDFIGAKIPSYYFRIYLHSWTLAVLAVVPVIIAKLPARLRRLAVLPLIR